MTDSIGRQKRNSLAANFAVTQEVQMSIRSIVGNSFINNNVSATTDLRRRFDANEVPLDFAGVKGDINRSVDRKDIVAQFRLFEEIPPAVRSHFNEIRGGVVQAFNEPFARKVSGIEYGRIATDLTFQGYLGKNTTDPPMFDDRVYSAYVSRPFEKALMKQIGADSGFISHKRLVATAMNVCGNDKSLAALTLANFTKNLAAVARGSASVPDSPNLRMGFPYDTYSKSQAANVLSRIEKFDERTQNKMTTIDAPGALYHFYGAILASSAGLGIKVHGENAVFGQNRDPIKRESGSLGVDAGKDVFGWATRLNDSIKGLFDSR